LLPALSFPSLASRSPHFDRGEVAGPDRNSANVPASANPAPAVNLKGTAGGEPGGQLRAAAGLGEPGGNVVGRRCLYDQDNSTGTIRSQDVAE